MAELYDSSLTAYHISANLKDYEAARSGFFSFIVPKKTEDDALVKATFTGDNPGANDVYAQDTWRDNLRLNVVSVNLA